MEIIPADSSLFRSSVDALKDFLPQAQLRISSDGIRINGMDVSHVGFVDYLLSAQDCETIKVKTPHIIGMNMSILSRTLAAVGSGDRVTLTTNKGGDKLVVSYTNEKVGKKAVYELPTLEILAEAMDLPEMTYNGSVVARTADVFTAIKEVAAFGDAIRMRLDEDGFHLSAAGDNGQARQTLENTEDRDMTLLTDSVEAGFATKYVMSILKGGSPISNTLSLDFDPAQPLRASFKFGTGSHFIAYLAPKIDDE
jgi:proliferating cell nuclear antigen